MEIKRSKIKDILRYNYDKFEIVNIVLEKSRKGWKGKKEIYNVVLTAYNQKANCILDKFKIGDTVDIRFRIKSTIKPNRIQTILIIQNVDFWKTKAEVMAEKYKENQSVINNTGLKIDEETGEILE